MMQTKAMNYSHKKAPSKLNDNEEKRREDREERTVFPLLLLSTHLTLANIPILCPLKTLQNLWFFGVFWGYNMGTLAGDRLNLSSHHIESTSGGVI